MNNAVCMTAKLITLPLAADIDSTISSVPIASVYACAANTGLCRGNVRRKCAFNICDAHTGQ